MKKDSAFLASLLLAGSLISEGTSRVKMPSLDIENEVKSHTPKEKHRRWKNKLAKMARRKNRY